MRRLPALLAGALTAALCGAAPAQETNQPIETGDLERRGPAIWRLADDDSEIFLFGSVHMLDPALDWRRPMLSRAMQAADVVYFEAPTDLVEQSKVQMLLINIGFNGPDTRLTDFLSDEGDERLERVAEDMNLPFATLQAMRPWLAMMTLTAKQAEREGADPNYGVEVQLGLDARKAGKEIRTFETLEQQTRFFAEMSLTAQIDLLENTLEQIEHTPEAMDAMVDAWISGALADLETLVFDGLDEVPPEFFEVIFARRNAAWAKEIEQLMAGEGRALIVVGAGHLLGPDSVLTLLAARGYKVERL